MHVVLWDIDGTLIRGQGMGSLALHRAFEEVFAVQAVGRDELSGIPFNGRTDPAILADLTAALGITPAAYDARRGDFTESYLRHLRVTVAESPNKRVLPGVHEALDALRARPDVEQGLLTGNIEAGARIKLEPFGLNPYFAFGGFGDDGPDRAVLAERAGERARARLGDAYASERVLVVGDTPNDVAAARAQGFAAVAVATGGVPLEALHAAEPDVVFPDLGPQHGFAAWLEERLA